MNINHPHHRIIHSPEEISTNCSPLLSPDLQQDIQGKEIVQDGLVLEPAIFTNEKDDYPIIILTMLWMCTRVWRNYL